MSFTYIGNRAIFPVLSGGCTHIIPAVTRVKQNPLYLNSSMFEKCPVTNRKILNPKSFICICDAIDWSRKRPPKYLFGPDGGPFSISDTIRGARSTSFGNGVQSPPTTTPLLLYTHTQSIAPRSPATLVPLARCRRDGLPAGTGAIRHDRGGNPARQRLTSHTHTCRRPAFPLRRRADVPTAFFFHDPTAALYQLQPPAAPRLDAAVRRAGTERNV